MEIFKIKENKFRTCETSSGKYRAKTTITEVIENVAYRQLSYVTFRGNIVYLEERAVTKNKEPKELEENNLTSILRVREVNEDLDIYQRNGYDSRDKYLAELSGNYGIDYEDVLIIANLFGESEDFDGLISSLEDYEYR